MRWFKLTFASLTLALVLCAPALAQSSPAAHQYDPGMAETQSVIDGVEDIAGNAEQGTAAVNDAMNDAVEGPVAGTSAPASSEAVLSTRTGASPENASSPGPGAGEDVATTYGGGGTASITVLPETGGASPTLLGLGVLLAAAGLLTRGVVER